MVAGFQIKAQREDVVIDANVPWFTNAGASYTAYTDGITDTTFTSAGHPFIVGDIVSIFSTTGTSINLDFGNVISITTDTFTISQAVGAPDGGGNTGDVFRHASITWDESTPAPPFAGSEGFLREIHIQFSTSASVVVSVTFDDGNTFVPLNNNAGIFGLATFTMFVKSDTKLNFKSSGNVTFSITVTGD